MSRPLFIIASACLALLGGCGLMPRDIAGTRARVENSHVIRAGILESALSGGDRERVVHYLDRLGRITGARVRIVAEAGEPLLVKLQEGQLDLVIGEVAADGPWLAEVAVIEPLAEREVSGRMIGLSPIARNGENRWIMLLEATVRDIRSGL